MCDSLFTPAGTKCCLFPLFENCEKSGEFLELFVITAVDVPTFMMHYSIISPIPAAGCGACLEQNASVFPTYSPALWLQFSEACLASIASRKERAERIISHKSKCFPMLAPRAEQQLAARHSRLNLSHPGWFQEQQLIYSGQNRHDYCGGGKHLAFVNYRLHVRCMCPLEDMIAKL